MEQQFWTVWYFYLFHMMLIVFYLIPLVNKHSYWTWPFIVDFPKEWWSSIAMLVYQRVYIYIYYIYISIYPILFYSILFYSILFYSISLSLSFFCGLLCISTHPGAPSIAICTAPGAPAARAASVTLCGFGWPLARPVLRSFPIGFCVIGKP